MKLCDVFDEPGIRASINKVTCIVTQRPQTKPFSLCPLLAAFLLCLTFFSSNLIASPFTPAEQQWLKAHPVIRLAPDPSFAPVEYFDENNQFQGITADYVKQLERITGLTIEIVQFKHWDGVIDAAKKREIDMLGAVAQTADRNNYLHFSQPYLTLPAVIITHKDQQRIHSMKDLKGKKVTVVKDYATHDFLVSNHPELEVIAVPDIYTGLRMVAFNLADAIVASSGSATYTIEKYGLNNLKVVAESGFEWQLSFAVRKDWPQFPLILDKAVAELGKQQQQAIFRKWIHLGHPGLRLTQDMLFVLFLVTTLILLAVAYLWIVMLKKQVASNTADLTQELQKREALEQKLRHQASTDELTGLYNRRKITKLIDYEVARFARSHHPIALLLIDIDHFKRINDTYGHNAGDYVLKCIATLLEQQLREVDFLGRLGGEEFLGLLVDIPPVEARNIADRVCLAVEKTPIELDLPDTNQHPVLNLTISVGISYSSEGVTAESLMSQADQAMYRAKHKGRNQVEEHLAV